MYKIICGDALEEMKKLESESVDLTVTSPPYDDLRSYKGYSFSFEGIAGELFRVTTTGGGSSVGSWRCNGGWFRDRDIF